MDLHVSVRSIRELEAGEYLHSLELRLKGSEEIVRLPIRLRIMPRLSVVPATVFLRKRPDGVSYEPADVVLIGRAAEQRLTCVELSEGPLGVRVEDLGPLGPHRRRARIEFPVDPSIQHHSSMTLSCGDLGAVKVLLRPPLPAVTASIVDGVLTEVAN